MIDIRIDPKQWAAIRLALRSEISKAARRALGKAGKTALRDMRSEASKRIRARKRIAAKYVNRALRLRSPRSLAGRGDIFEWAVDVRGTPVPLIAYPHRQTKLPKGPRRGSRMGKGGVYVQVNRGLRSFVKGAFVAKMKSGHVGIFVRGGVESLPIHERFGSRPVDALLHKGEGEAVAARGAASFVATFNRLLPIELEKDKGGS